jgi:hypothetical protein
VVSLVTLEVHEVLVAALSSSSLLLLLSLSSPLASAGLGDLEAQVFRTKPSSARARRTRAPECRGLRAGWCHLEIAS